MRERTGNSERVSACRLEFRHDPKAKPWENEMRERLIDASNRHLARGRRRGRRGPCADKGAREAELDLRENGDRVMLRMCGVPRFVYCNFRLCENWSCMEYMEDVAEIMLGYVEAGHVMRKRAMDWTESARPIAAEDEEPATFAARVRRWEWKLNWTIATNRQIDLQIEHWRGLVEHRDVRLERMALMEKEE